VLIAWGADQCGSSGALSSRPGFAGKRLACICGRPGLASVAVGDRANGPRDRPWRRGCPPTRLHVRRLAASPVRRDSLRMFGSSLALGLKETDADLPVRSSLKAREVWLGGRDSNPDNVVQRHARSLVTSAQGSVVWYDPDQTCTDASAPNGFVCRNLQTRQPWTSSTANRQGPP